jgi:hypothetical protein
MAFSLRLLTQAEPDRQINASRQVSQDFGGRHFFELTWIARSRVSQGSVEAGEIASQWPAGHLRQKERQNDFDRRNVPLGSSWEGDWPGLACLTKTDFERGQRVKKLSPTNFFPKK